MEKRYIAALDQGTTSSRCILFDREQNMVGMAQKEFTQFYPKEGWVLVDSFSCRELNICLEDALDGTNVFMGTFYLSSDLQHLYKRMDDNSIVQMELDD